MVTIQYVSDLHLEMDDTDDVIRTIQKIAPYLVLAGDIGDPSTKRYMEFIRHCSEMGYERVFVIAGNHEYYGHSVTDTEIILRDVCAAFDNVTYLQNDCHETDDMVIFGGTMWTYVEDPKDYWIVSNCVRDYSRIQSFNVGESNRLHVEFCKRLKDAVDAYICDFRPFLVISHHLPWTKLIDKKYGNCISNAAFACDVDIAFSQRINGWIAGHTHTSICTGKFRVNPIGYPGENENASANVIASFTVGTTENLA